MSTVTSAKNIIHSSHETPLCFCCKGRVIRAVNSETGEIACTYPSAAVSVSILTMNPDLDVMVSCDDNGVIMARATKTSNRFWSKAMKAQVVSLEATDFLLFALLSNGRLECCWLTDGSPLWSRAVSKARSNNMILVETLLITTSTIGQISASSMLDGSSQWDIAPASPSTKDCINCLNDNDDGLVAFGTRGGKVIVRR